MYGEGPPEAVAMAIPLITVHPVWEEDVLTDGVEVTLMLTVWVEVQLFESVTSAVYVPVVSPVAVLVVFPPGDHK